MCLGVPMRIKTIDGFTARCEARGIERTASLFLLQHENLEVGDLVMIHVGNAIQKMSEEEAQTAWDLYDEILQAEVADLNRGTPLAADAAFGDLTKSRNERAPTINEIGGGEEGSSPPSRASVGARPLRDGQE
jgi:hydrogenase expression/formation protein HypC